jgi:ankyrin repeat protein
MITGSYNIDKYVLPNFIDKSIVISIIFSCKYFKNIINNCHKIQRYKYVDYTNRGDGDTPLHITCEYGSEPCAKLLIKIGANVNKQNTAGETPLMAACYGKDDHTDIVKLLLHYGADVNITSRGGTALHFACCKGNTKCAELLIKNGININKIYDYGLTALHNACNFGYDKCASLLINAKANIHLKTYHLQLSALDLAKANNHTKCIDLFYNSEKY